MFHSASSFSWAPAHVRSSALRSSGNGRDLTYESGVGERIKLSHSGSLEFFHRNFKFKCKMTVQLSLL